MRILEANNKHKENNQRSSCTRDFPDLPDLLGVGSLLVWGGLEVVLAPLAWRTGSGKGDIMTGAGAGVSGSEADSGSGGTTGRKGEGAHTAVLVAMSVA